MTTRNINPKELQRDRSKLPEKNDQPTPQPVANGSVDKMMDAIIAPGDEALRSLTVIDRIQGRLFPIVDMVNDEFHYVLEIASYRQDKDKYEESYKKKTPVMPDWLFMFLKRTAQWQKSVSGKTLEAGKDITLAQLESQGDSFGDSLKDAKFE